MATASLNSTALFFVATNEGSYAAAREGSGVSKYISQYGWVGQYFGGNYEVNQVFAGFDLSSLPANAVITAAKLTLTISESYGTTVVEVRQHDFQANSINAFVAGSQLANKPLLGGANINDGFIGTVAVDLTGLTRVGLAKFVLASTTQRTGTAPTGDTTTRVTAAKLDVTYSLVTLLTTTGASQVTAPTGVTGALVEVWGAGGGGPPYGGGGGGAYSASRLTFTAGSTLNAFVGAGGAGGYITPPPGAPGGDGQDTWFISSSTILAKGGGGGWNTSAMGGQASAGIGTTKFSGGAGTGNAGYVGGGAGGPNGNGQTGSGNGGTTTGNNENGGGSGGAPGGGGVSNPSGVGSAGGRGQIRITWDDSGSTNPPAPARRAPRSFFWL